MVFFTQQSSFIFNTVYHGNHITLKPEHISSTEPCKQTTTQLQYTKNI